LLSLSIAAGEICLRCITQDEKGLVSNEVLKRSVRFDPININELKSVKYSIITYLRPS
jgi:hypothetical protein